MPHIVTLKDSNDDASYPITPVDAVFVDSNTTLSDLLNDKADADLSNVGAGSITTSLLSSGAVTSDKIDWSTMPGNYSLNEIDTGYTWIDGKTIYKKTISTGAMPNNTNKLVTHNIANLYRVIRIEGYAYNPSIPRHQALPMVSSGGSGQVSVSVGTTQIELVAGGDRSAYTESYVTLYYTKSS